ncbi:MAG: type II toxin-antitoxin system RelE/ParE family toxin [Candidatus Omnitrophica bacterium]|nr:type II toxin-antitoxin system RelE/ParE family toxin [Candidatus Omnitrophota bacterium]
MFKLVLLTGARKAYEKLFVSDRAHFDRVRAAIHALSAEPYLGKPLRHELKGKYSLRVGVYRIIYRVERREVIVYVLDIGHRREIYQ